MFKGASASEVIITQFLYQEFMENYTKRDNNIEDLVFPQTLKLFHINGSSAFFLNRNYQVFTYISPTSFFAGADVGDCFMFNDVHITATFSIFSRLPTRRGDENPLINAIVRKRKSIHVLEDIDPNANLTTKAVGSVYKKVSK